MTHATPAGAYAHTAERYWESDGDASNKEVKCRDIAVQLVEDNWDINVMEQYLRYTTCTTVYPDALCLLQVTLEGALLWTGCTGRCFVIDRLYWEVICC